MDLNNNGHYNIFQDETLIPSSVKMSISSSSSESLSFGKSSGLQLRFTNMIMITKRWRASILFNIYFNQNGMDHLKRLIITISQENKIISQMLMPKSKLQMRYFVSFAINSNFPSFNFNLIKSR